MLVNMIGIEKEDEIADLDSRRSALPFDPKARVTLATLVEAALTPQPEASSPGRRQPNPAEASDIKGLKRDSVAPAVNRQEHVA